MERPRDFFALHDSYGIGDAVDAHLSDGVVEQSVAILGVMFPDEDGVLRSVGPDVVTDVGAVEADNALVHGITFHTMLHHHLRRSART